MDLGKASSVTEDNPAQTGASPPSPPRPRNRLLRWLVGRSLRQMGRLGVLLVLTVTAAFGGLDTVDGHVTSVAVGEEFNDGPFTVTVDRARLVPQLVAGRRMLLPPQPGRRYLAVVVTLVSNGIIPVLLADQIELVGVADAKWAKAMRIADSTMTIWQGPGLTDQLAFVWTVPEGTVRIGDPVAIRLWKQQFTELKVTYGRTWIDSVTDYGQVAVPVTPPS